jgi:hypothetical protein
MRTASAVHVPERIPTGAAGEGRDWRARGVLGHPESMPDRKLPPTTRTVGRVKGFKRGTFTILLPNGRFQRFATDESTKVLAAATGSLQDIGEGSRVVVKFEPGNPDAARELIVLPTEDTYGMAVTAVEGDRITVKNHVGVAQTIDVSAAAIDKTSNATIEDVASGSIVFAMLDVSNVGALSAAELIVLPDATSWGS